MYLLSYILVVLSVGSQPNRQMVKLLKRLGNSSVIHSVISFTILIPIFLAPHSFKSILKLEQLIAFSQVLSLQLF